MQISVSWSPPNGVPQRRAAVHAGRQLGGCTSRRLGGYPFRRFELISSAIHGYLPLRIISTELPRDIRRETSRILPKYLTADDTRASKLVGRVVDTPCCFARQDPKINAKTRFPPRHRSRAAGPKPGRITPSAVRYSGRRSSFWNLVSKRIPGVLVSSTRWYQTISGTNHHPELEASVVRE